MLKKLLVIAVLACAGVARADGPFGGEGPFPSAGSSGGGGGTTTIITSGDNLGNHIATKTVDMAGNDLLNATTVQADTVNAGTELCLVGDCRTAWPTSGSNEGDNFGNHKATQAVDMSGFNINDAGEVNADTVTAPAIYTSSINALSPLRIEATELRVAATTFFKAFEIMPGAVTDGFSFHPNGNGGVFAQTTTGTIPMSGSQSFTMEAWVLSDALSGQECFMDFGDGSAANNATLCFTQPSNGVIDGVYFTDSVLDQSVSTSLTVGVWLHVAVSYNGVDTLRFFVNGVDVGTKTYTPSLSIGNYITVGRRVNGGAPYAGKIDEAIYSDYEKYTGNFSPSNRATPDGHTFALYRFDEGGGTYIADASTQANSMTANGEVWETGHPDSGPTSGDSFNEFHPSTSSAHGMSTRALGLEGAILQGNKIPSDEGVIRYDDSLKTVCVSTATNKWSWTKMDGSVCQ